MPFTKGQSGNPGGRAKAVLSDGRTLAEVARDHTEEAIETIASVMRDFKAPPAARLAAATAMLDRAWGRAVQAVEYSGRPEEPVYTNPDQARAEIARYLEQARQKYEASLAA